MEIASFARSDGEVVATWPTSAADASAWCGADAVDAATVVRWNDSEDVEGFVARIADEPVAYGELWIEDDEVELAHLIVRPDRRSSGLGRRFVEELVDRARRHASFVALRVVPENAAAIRCYAAAGFERAAPEDEAEWNTGQPRAYVWMLHHPAATGRNR